MTIRTNSVRGLGSILSDLLRGMDIDTKIKEHTCLVVWDEIVGERVANSAQPNFVKDGLMFVTTKSPVWANELSLYKRDIISRINARVGSQILKDIVFKSGSISRKKPDHVKAEKDSFDLGGIKLRDEELERIEAVAGEAGIDVSASMRDLLITAARLEKWKKAKGWKQCKCCGVLHGNDSETCPVCVIQSK